MALPVDGSGYLFHINNTDKVQPGVRHPRVRRPRATAGVAAGRRRLPRQPRAVDTAPASGSPRRPRAHLPGHRALHGQRFRLRHHPEYDKAFDTVIQAMTGMMATTGFPDGPPTKAGFSLAGLSGRLRIRGRVLLRLCEPSRAPFGDRRHRDGRALRPVRVRRSMGRTPTPSAWATVPAIARTRPRTSTGVPTVGSPSDRYHRPTTRSSPHSPRSVAQALSAARTAGVAASPALELAEVLDDPHLIARGVVMELATPAGDTTARSRTPMTYLRAPVRVRAAAPWLNPARGTPCRPNPPCPARRPAVMERTLAYDDILYSVSDRVATITINPTGVAQLPADAPYAELSRAFLGSGRRQSGRGHRHHRRRREGVLRGR